MKKIRKFLSIAMAFLMVLVTMTAVQAEGKTKLVFLHAGTDEGRVSAFQAIIKAFEAANPDVEVEIQNAGFGDDMETKLNTGFASDTAPDVMYFTLASMGVRIPLGQYQPLNDFAADWDGMTDYLPSALRLGSVGDTLYGVPYFGDARVTVMNTELVKEAGLDPATPPKNWQELMAWHKQLIKKDENGNVIQTGFGLPTSGINLQHWLSIFGFQNGVKNLVDEATNEILLNSPEMVEALTFMNELRKEGVVDWNANQSDQNPISNGTAAIGTCTTTDFAAYNQGELEGKLVMCPPLANRQPGTFCGMHFLYMSAESQHKEAAWKLMTFMAQPEAISIWMEKLNAAPLRQSMQEAYKAEKPDTAPFILDAIAAGVGSPKVTYSNSLFNITGAAVEKVFYDKATPQEALDEAAKLIADEIDFQ